MKFLTEKKLQKLLDEHTQAAMIDRARYYENEILKKQTELLTLQNQINPHFLYNSLECIRAQASQTSSVTASAQKVILPP